jgi:hypothetical protein
MSRYAARTLISGQRDAPGQVLLLVAASLVALIGFAALSVDIGTYVRARQQVENAVDAAALAGAQVLPDNGTEAENLARQYAVRNGLDPADANVELTISFRCIVGDHDGDGEPDAEDINAVCPQVDPGFDPYRCENGLCFIACDFDDSDNKCNAIVVDGQRNHVPFVLAPVLGVRDADTGAIRGSACRGLCGAPPTGAPLTGAPLTGAPLTIPLDVVMIIDRTNSMEIPPDYPTPLDKAKAAARAVLEMYNPERQHVALGVLPPSDPTNLCDAVADGTWLPVPLSNDYKNPDGSLNESSLLVSTIGCLKTPSHVGVGTDLGNPILTAREQLEAGRIEAKKGIILLTDGEPNAPADRSPCEFAFNQANMAKESGVEIFTIGFGVAGKICADEQAGSFYLGKHVTTLLADMATDSEDDHNHCATADDAAAENADGDHFLCQPKSGDLTPVFRQAAEALAAGSRLVHVLDPE